MARRAAHGSGAVGAEPETAPLLAESINAAGNVAHSEGRGAPQGGPTLPISVVAAMLLVVQAGFGGYGIMLRKFCGDAHANALVVSFYRDALAFPVLLLAARLIEGPFRVPTRGRELALFCGLGLTGMFGGQLFYVLGVFYAGPDIASVLQPAMPVWTAIFVVIVRVEAVPNVCELNGFLKVVGVLCAAGGAATMLVAKGHGSEYPQPLLGALFSLINTVLFAIYITIQKLCIFSPTGTCHGRWAETPIYVTAWAYGFGAIFMILGGIVGFYSHLGLFGFEADSGTCDLNATVVGEGCSGQNSSATDPIGWKYICVAAGNDDGDTGMCHAKSNTLMLPTKAWYALVYAVCITSALNYGLITVANKNCRTSVVSAFWPVQVFVNVTLAYMVFNDRLNAAQYIGGGLIILGLLCVLKSTNSDTDAAGKRATKGPEDVYE